MIFAARKIYFKGNVFICSRCWMISILVQYPGELGLRKYQKSFYSILTESLTPGQKETSKSRKTGSTTDKTDVSPKHKNSNVQKNAK